MNSNNWYFVGLPIVLFNIAPAQAVDFNYSGATVHFPEIPGYCVLNESLEIDAALIKFLRDLQKPRNTLVTAFVDCEQLRAYKTGAAPSFSRHGNFLIQNDPKTGKPADMSRVKVKEYYASAARASTGAAFKDAISNEFSSKIEKSASEMGMELKLGKTNVAVLRLNEDALYMAMAENLKTTDNAIPVAGVFALQLVNGLSVSTNLYDRYENDQTYVVIDKQVQKIVAEINVKNRKSTVTIDQTASQTEERPHHIEATEAKLPASVMNQTLELPDPSPNFNWGRVAEKGVIGALVGGIIALIGALFRRKDKN